MRVLSSAVLVMVVMFAVASGASSAKAQTNTPWLGVGLQVVEAEDARKMGIEGGLKVTRVDDKSPAKEAGLEVGDIILSAGQSTITSIEAMRKELADKRPGDVLSLGVRRANGRNEPLIVVLGAQGAKDDRFGDDAKVRELRKKLSELDAERRRTAAELERRLEDLRSGKANPETAPQPPQPRVEEPANPKPAEPKVTEPERATLGVTLNASFLNLTPEESRALGIEGGIKASSVSAGGAAAEGGLKEGDVITRANGEAMTGTGHLRTMLSRMKAGDKLELEVLRGGKKVNLTLVLRPRA
ncbi:MAG: PDZ domain-containing protein [Planctomycetes bacterium]|jgi:S1-C subfamily serine protease|nr:PDZ domain-containing protein [Planctomycetota bacterium]MCL4729330.1 PDZ domain-containing protein [Planctomycetota bacterium]